MSDTVSILEKFTKVSNRKVGLGDSAAGETKDFER
jgi:hypothetical protein